MAPHQPQQTARRKLLAAARTIVAARHPSIHPALPPAFFLTDPDRTPDPASIIARLPPGWGVIYRHFGAPGREAIAQTLAKIASNRGLILLVSADPGLAHRVEAHGIHWPQRMLAQRNPRHHVGLETASAHDLSDIRNAAKAGINAAILSAIYASDSRSAPAPTGLMRTLAIARTAPLPIYTLGGVTSANAGRFAAGGRTSPIAGFAAVSTISNAWK